MLRIIMPLMAALMLASAPVKAGDFDKGLAAYKKGDYATALREFKSLAEQGNANAQVSLGVMYADGQGVLQDYKQAAKWCLTSAPLGHTEVFS